MIYALSDENLAVGELRVIPDVNQMLPNLVIY